METKVAEINATLNSGRGNQRLQKLKRLNLARILEFDHFM